MLGSARASRLAEVSVLIAANLAATVVRFLLYRFWVFGRPQRPPDAQPPKHQLTGNQLAGPVHRNEMATQGERSS
jgi:hypothetical protein